MRRRSRARRVVVWGTVLVFAAVAGGLAFAYFYVTDSDTLAALIKQEAPKYLPGSNLTVDRVRLRPFVGDVILTQVALRQRLGGRAFPTLRAPWVRIQLDFDAMLRGQNRPREVVVAQPVLRLGRRQDGTWNLQGMLADPWPDPPMARLPVVQIQNGTVELVDEVGSATVLREVAIRLEPAAGGAVRFEGSAKGEDLFERIRVEGTIDRATGRVELRTGELTRLAISEVLRRRLPAEVRPMFDRIGLVAGEVDLALSRLSYDPSSPEGLRYEGVARLRSGAWNCPELPFPLNDVSAVAAVRDGVLAIGRTEPARGVNGKTVVRGWGALAVADPAREPMDGLLVFGKFHYDHRNPSEFSGDNSLENCQCLCVGCHGAKTARKDIPAIAKSNRLRSTTAGIRRERKIRAWRNFAGEIVRKPARRDQD